MGLAVRTTIFGVMILLCQGVLAESVDIRGEDLSFSHPGYKNTINRIWNFVSSDLAPGDGRTIQAPVLYLESFNRSEQSDEWNTWQTEWFVKSPAVWLEWTQFAGMPVQEANQDWVRENLDFAYPFERNFRGLHYEGTNRVQVNPSSTFLAYYQNGPDGVKRDLVGYGYYVTGHELTHHMLAERGVPEKLHHCMYVTRVDDKPSLMESLIQFLVKDGIASDMVAFYGMKQEVDMNPCEHLDEQSRLSALAYARQIQQPILTALKDIGDKN